MTQSEAWEATVTVRLQSLVSMLQGDKAEAVRQLLKTWTSPDRQRPEFGELERQVAELELGPVADSLLQAIREGAKFEEPFP